MPKQERETYKKPFLITYTGKVVNPLDMSVDDICIEDIAHALSNVCRYGGHIKKFYSVAEHCILMAASDFPGPAPWKLMHDASEAYLPDICAGIKSYIVGFKKIEEKLLGVIAKKYGLPLLEGELLKEVKKGDILIRYWEGKALMPYSKRKEFRDWNGSKPKVKVEICNWTPWQAEELFLKCFHEMFENLEKYYNEECE